MWKAAQLDPDIWGPPSTMVMQRWSKDPGEVIQRNQSMGS